MTSHDLMADQVLRVLRARCLYTPRPALDALIDEVVMASTRLGHVCIDARHLGIFAPLRGLSLGSALAVLRRLREEMQPQPIIKTNALTVYGIKEVEAGMAEWNMLEAAAHALGSIQIGGAA